ncbi:MAG: GDP-mannose 4,6-dehydratase [Candidatus Helarchaeota archaeon]
MEILVTGCAGFIGSHLTKKLLEEGHTVIGIDSLDPFYSTIIKQERLEILNKYPEFKFFKNDLQEIDKIDVIFANNSIDQIIHIAARAGVRTSIKVPLSYIDYNIKVTNYLLEQSVKYSINNFIFASSSSVYGNCETIPFDEKAELNPISPYAASKRSCELYGAVYSNLYDINFTSLRLFTVYGPSQREDMAISRFTNWIDKGNKIKLYGTGESKRDFTYVDDIVNGIQLAVKKNYKNEIFNLGSGKTISIIELIRLIEEKLDKKANIEFLPPQKGDVEITLANISKANKMLGYSPQVSISNGLDKYIEWYQNRKKNKSFPII